MPKKVILYGDALKLLYTFLEYADEHPERFCSAMCYDLQGLKVRRAQLQEQIDAGIDISWDKLEQELKQLEG